jgi:hypothetical protein
LYTAPAGAASFPLSTQIHDYNVHIDRNDVFWMIPVSDDAVEVDFDGAHARLCVRNLDVFDDHDLANSLTQGLGVPTPPVNQPGVFPVRAKVSFDVEWNGPSVTAQIEPGALFKGTFLSTGATISWSVEQDGFSFQSESPLPSRNLISVLGREQNGVFFS